MTIQNFPAALQPIIQQGFLEREFQQGLRSKLGYRAIADRKSIPTRVGETLTSTRAGLKPSATTPLNPATNTNLDNGLTPSGWGIEQYTIAVSAYGDTQDLNMVTEKVGIASQFLQNAKVNGEQAARTMDELARNALFDVYLGGNSRVRTTLGAAGPSVAVDDLRGFRYVYVNGVKTAVSAGNPLLVTIGANTYNVIGYVQDVLSVSTAPNGVSGTLTLATSVTVSDGTAGNVVQAATAPVVLRPNGKGTTALLSQGDTLSLAVLLDAVAKLRLNNVPDLDGAFNCYLDPVSARQLFADPDFKILFQGATSASQVFKQGMVSDFLGLRFMTTTEAFVQASPSVAGAVIRRPIICGQGALIEGDFAGMAAQDVSPGNADVRIVDDVAMVTREPIDRLAQIIAQSWYWMGGFCAPSDITTNPLTLPTATNSTFKRAVMLEHIG